MFFERDNASLSSSFTAISVELKRLKIENYRKRLNANGIAVVIAIRTKRVALENEETIGCQDIY